jgi:glycosyltransferase involved in cell wall biosynthesis
VLALVDGIMVLSQEEQRQLTAFRNRPQVFTVKNPYLRSFSSDLAQAAAKTRANGRILFVGRLIEEKGIFDLIEALPHVLEQTECDLVIVGEGEEKAKLMERIRRLGIEDHVTLAGYLSGSELESTYHESTMLVLPSWSEGFPTVLAEAMDAGLPIVTTRIRGAADHLAAGEHALFVEPRDVKGLASAMTKVLTDRDLRARMSSANRAHIRIFEPRAVAGEYLEVLQSLIREESHGHANRRAV